MHRRGDQQGQQFRRWTQGSRSRCKARRAFRSPHRYDIPGNERASTSASASCSRCLELNGPPHESDSSPSSESAPSWSILGLLWTSDFQAVVACVIGLDRSTLFSKVELILQRSGSNWDPPVSRAVPPEGSSTWEHRSQSTIAAHVDALARGATSMPCTAGEFGLRGCCYDGVPLFLAPDCGFSEHTDHHTSRFNFVFDNCLQFLQSCTADSSFLTFPERHKQQALVSLLTQVPGNCQRRCRLHEQSFLGIRVRINRRLSLSACDAAAACDDDAAGVSLLRLLHFGHFSLPPQPTPHLSSHFFDPIFLLLAE